MDPISVIIAALIAGAGKGVGTAASAAVADGYVALKKLVKSRLANRPAGDVVLSQFEASPQDYERPLRKELEESHAVNKEVLEAAHKLLAMADPKGCVEGKYSSIDLRGAQGVYVGDKGHQKNTFE